MQKKKIFHSCYCFYKRLPVGTAETANGGVREGEREKSAEAEGRAEREDERDGGGDQEAEGQDGGHRAGQGQGNKNTEGKIGNISREVFCVENINLCSLAKLQSCLR